MKNYCRVTPSFFLIIKNFERPFGFIFKSKDYRKAILILKITEYIRVDKLSQINVRDVIEEKEYS